MLHRYFLIVLAILYAAAGAAFAQTVPVTGVVTGPAGPVAGAVVEFHASNTPTPVTATTDAAGKFAANIPGETVIAHVATGFVTIHLTSPPGAGLFSDDLTLSDVPANLEIHLEMARPVTLDVRALLPPGASAGGIQLDVYSLTSDRQYHSGAGPAARFTVFPDLYSVHARSAAADFYFGRVNLDARQTSSLAVDVAMKKNEPILTRTPPRASLISISAPAANGMATVSGQAGSVEPLASVVAVNCNTHQAGITVSASDGSFSLPLFATPGSSVQIKQDPTGRYLPNMNLSGGPEFESPPGTIISVNPPVNGAPSWSATGYVNQAEGLGLHWRSLRATGVVDAGQWALTSTTSPATFTPGQTGTLSGKLTIYSKDIDSNLSLANVNVNGKIMLTRTFDSGGTQRTRDDQFFSSVMTPSGLPIERFDYGGVFIPVRFGPPRLVAAGMLEADWTASGTVPASLEAGYFVPIVSVNIGGIAQQQRHFDALPTPGGHPAPSWGSPLPVVKIGAPSAPRIACVLALDDLTNGLRGSVALEDRGKFQVASHVAIGSDVTVLPPIDQRTGETLRYRLEPFAPMISYSTNGQVAYPPRLAFKFPSGSLSVRVLRPDGTTDDLGSAPFQQSMNRSPLSRRGSPISSASSHATDYFQLTTLDPRFEYAFTQYGLHRVSMDMEIEDVNGNLYRGGGTYEIWVARPLDIETAVIPGTPFGAGDVFSPALIVAPGVPADVRVRLQVLPNSDATKAVIREVSGRANRFGVFVPSSGFPPFGQPGEYRADVFARYTDPSGVMWVGTATWGNVVETPGSPLVTHGRRGFDSVNAIQPQWFRVREARAGGDHVMFPFHRGDVMWMGHDDPAADIPKITVQDPQGDFASRVRVRSGVYVEPPSLEDRISTGEIPLFSTSSSGESVSLAPAATDQWGYFYAYAERPGVHVRELISEDQSQNAYWRFADNYHFQLGNGLNGDQPNDFKFQFGGAVWRDATGFSYYGAYGSFFVLLPSNDAVGGRVFPPFQGNGGGPSGGSLFTLKGKPIDLFLHPTAVRPGTILQLGERASFTGHSAPTLPSKISIAITSPGGHTRTVSGQANKIGYFHDPAQDFTVDEAGVWKAKVKILFDGVTSAGQVQQPYPAGDALGSREGEFYFYVVPANAPQVEIAPMSQFVRPADGPITFTLAPPAGLTNVQMTYTTTMPGFVLEEGTASALTYAYDAQKLAKDFPNIDLYDADGFAGVDTITMSFLVSGTDATGTRKHFARQIVLQGEEVQAPPQPPTSACAVVGGTRCVSRLGGSLQPRKGPPRNP